MGKFQRDLGLDQTSNFLLLGPKSVGSDVELRTRRTNQLNPTKKQFQPNKAKYSFSYKFLISSLVRIRRMCRSTFQPGDVLSVWGRRIERGRVVSASDSHSGGPGFCELTVSKYLSGVPVN